MAWKIRTFLGPEAVADRRAFDLAKIRAEEKLKLERELTKQVTKGDAATAAAILGTAPPPPPPPETSMLPDLSDPTTQIAAVAAAAAGWILYRRFA